METPSWHQHIAGLTILDPSDAEDFGYEKAVQILTERLALAPKFQWKLKEVPLGLDRPVWVEDTEFDINRHRRYPLWEYWYLDGLANGRVGGVLKFHHCLLDGVSGASLMDLGPDAPMPEPPDDTEQAGPEPSTLELLARSALPNVRTPGRVRQYGAQLVRRGAAILEFQREAESPNPMTGIPRTSWNAKIGPRS